MNCVEFHGFEIKFNHYEFHYILCSDVYAMVRTMLLTMYHKEILWINTPKPHYFLPFGRLALASDPKLTFSNCLVTLSFFSNTCSIIILAEEASVEAPIPENKPENDLLLASLWHCWQMPADEGAGRALGLRRPAGSSVCRLWLWEGRIAIIVGFSFLWDVMLSWRTFSFYFLSLI